ncbi:hypothetical protein EDC01DRAFT_645780 [Geopyxis carbonaria]|nr:hypothetical protein EDC01DRAFT_645780 [Geopyxis carbonaria]
MALGGGSFAPVLTKIRENAAGDEEEEQREDAEWEALGLVQEGSETETKKNKKDKVQVVGKEKDAWAGPKKRVSWNELFNDGLIDITASILAEPVPPHLATSSPPKPAKPSRSRRRPRKLSDQTAKKIKKAQGPTTYASVTAAEYKPPAPPKLTDDGVPTYATIVRGESRQREVEASRPAINIPRKTTMVVQGLMLPPERKEPVHQRITGKGALKSQSLAGAADRQREFGEGEIVVLHGIATSTARVKPKRNRAHAMDFF